MEAIAATSSALAAKCISLMAFIKSGPIFSGMFYLLVNKVVKYLLGEL
jgi:hypothetical protein